MPSASPRLTLSSRTLGVVRLGWAVALLAAPDAVVRGLGGRVDSRSVVVARILGARHAAQGAVELVAGTRWRRAGSMVDLAHGLSGVGFGLADARWRRPAFSDAVIAGAFALAGRE